MNSLVGHTLHAAVELCSWSVCYLAMHICGRSRYLDDRRLRFCCLFFRSSLGCSVDEIVQVGTPVCTCSRFSQPVGLTFYVLRPTIHPPDSSPIQTRCVPSRLSKFLPFSYFFHVPSLHRPRSISIPPSAEYQVPRQIPDPSRARSLLSFLDLIDARLPGDESCLGCRPSD